MRLVMISCFFLIASCNQGSRIELLLNLESGMTPSEVEDKAQVKLKTKEEIKDLAEKKGYSNINLYGETSGFEGFSSLTEVQKALLTDRFSEISFKGNSALATFEFISNELYSVDLTFSPYNSKEAAEICTILTKVLEKKPGESKKEISDKVKNAFSIDKNHFSIWCNPDDKKVSIFSFDMNIVKKKLSESTKQDL